MSWTQRSVEAWFNATVRTNPVEIFEKSVGEKFGRVLFRSMAIVWDDRIGSHEVWRALYVEIA